MSADASCPVFRCPKTNISQCAGYGRKCDRYYCQIHAKEKLCDRCAALKSESMKAGYKSMLKSLERKAYRASLTGGVIGLLSFSFLLLVMAIIFAWRQSSDRSLLPLFVVSLGGAVVGLGGTAVWYLMKARQYVRTESMELDSTHPGFYDYYQEWQAKVDEITSNL